MKRPRSTSLSVSPSPSNASYNESYDDTYGDDKSIEKNWHVNDDQTYRAECREEPHDNSIISSSIRREEKDDLLRSPRSKISRLNDRNQGQDIQTNAEDSFHSTIGYGLVCTLPPTCDGVTRVRSSKATRANPTGNRDGSSLIGVPEPKRERMSRADRTMAQVSNGLVEGDKTRYHSKDAKNAEEGAEEEEEEIGVRFDTLEALQSHYERFHSHVCHAVITDSGPRTGLGWLGPQEAMRDVERGDVEMDETCGINGVKQGTESAELSREAGGRERERDEREDVSVLKKGKRCGKVFPDARMLDLHIIENHDPLASVQQSQGYNIFQCFLPPDVCQKRFKSPKERRIHLIQSHYFPKQYFFAVTNYGIGDMIKRYGPGASLVRGDWKPQRPSCTIPDSSSPVVGNDQPMKISSPPPRKNLLTQNTSAQPIVGGDSTTHTAAVTADEQTRTTEKTSKSKEQQERGDLDIDMDMDALTATFSGTSLSFLPAAVRKKGKAKMMATG